MDNQLFEVFVCLGCMCLMQILWFFLVFIVLPMPQKEVEEKPAPEIYKGTKTEKAVSKWASWRPRMLEETA
jgi:hypothetical protein